MTVRSVIFDFDGTIADSFEATLRIANALAPVFGYRPADRAEVEVLRTWSYRQVAAELGVAWHKIPLIAARVRKELSENVAQMDTFAGMPAVLTESAKQSAPKSRYSDSRRPRAYASTKNKPTST